MEGTGRSDTARAGQKWPWERFPGLSGVWVGRPCKRRSTGLPGARFLEMPARNRLPCGLDAGFGTDGPTSVSGRDRGHSVPPRSSRPFSPVSVVTLSLFSI